VNKLRALLSLFKQGKRVANVEAWKTGQMSVEAVSGLLMAIVAVFVVFSGYEVEVNGEEIGAIATALVTIVPAFAGLWGAVSTVITTNKVGLRADSE